MLDKAAVIKTVEQYAQEVTKALKPAVIVLYGSYAKGTAREESDIDIAVIFNGYTGDWLQDSSMLWKIAHKNSLDIEPILLDSTKDRSGFVADILKTGQIIYSADENYPIRSEL